MAALFLDTSALVKRYIVEPGSAWVRSMTDARSSNRAYASALAGPELVATLVRGARDRRQLARQLPGLLADFRSQWTHLISVVELDDLAIFEAMRIAERHGLRGADAVHVGAAVVVQRGRQASGRGPITFISADEEQLGAAAREGLTVDDPRRHP